MGGPEGLGDIGAEIGAAGTRSYTVAGTPKPAGLKQGNKRNELRSQGEMRDTYTVPGRCEGGKGTPGKSK